MTSQQGDSDLVYLVTFSSDLGNVEYFFLFFFFENDQNNALIIGDAPLIQPDANTSASFINVTEITAGSTSRSTIQLLIEDVPSSLINLDASIANVSVYDL